MWRWIITMFAANEQNKTIKNIHSNRSIENSNGLQPQLE